VITPTSVEAGGGERHGEEAGDRMQWHPEKGPWRLNGNVRATAMQVAAKLARLEVIADLYYRGVRIEADAVDVTPCRKTVSGAFFRFFLLRPVSSPLSGLAHRVRLPEEWRSEAISIPRHAHPGLDDGLAHFETEFATCTFLQRIEHEIDGALQRVEDHDRSRAQR